MCRVGTVRGVVFFRIHSTFFDSISRRVVIPRIRAGIFIVEAKKIFYSPHLYGYLLFSLLDNEPLCILYTRCKSQYTFAAAHNDGEKNTANSIRRKQRDVIVPSGSSLGFFSSLAHYASPFSIVYQWICAGWRFTCMYVR